MFNASRPFDPSQSFVLNSYRDGRFYLQQGGVVYYGTTWQWEKEKTLKEEWPAVMHGLVLDGYFTKAEKAFNDMPSMFEWLIGR